MEIQWSLVLFTALTGLAGWLFVCVAVDEFLGCAKKASFPAAVVSIVVAIVGGLASVTHLSHPDRIMGALSHPTSGIFVEAVLIGCLIVCVAVYLVLLKRGAGAGARKAVAVVGAVFGVLLSFMAGESYLMSARPNWNTQLLPLGYLLTVAPAGIAAYLTVVAAVAGKGAGEAAGKDAAASLELKPYPMALLVAGVLSAVGVLAYTLSAGASDGAAFGLLALAVIAGGVVPCVAGALLPKKPESLLALAAVSCVCALVGAIAYRCIMWVVTVPVADLLMTVI